MAAANVDTGYDPASSQVLSIEISSPAKTMPSEDEYLDDMVRQGKSKSPSQQQRDAAAGRHSPQLSKERRRAIPPVPAKQRKWRPRQAPRLSPDDSIVVVKPRVPCELRTFVPADHAAIVALQVANCRPKRGLGLVISLSPPARTAHSAAVAVTFEGKKLPRFLFYHCAATYIRPYKETGPVCTKCGTIGHRPPECPHLAPTQCAKCGTPAPAGLTAHDCHPKCLLCHSAHETGTRGCAAKYRKRKQPSTSPRGTTSSSSQPDNGTNLHQSGPPFHGNTQAFPPLVAPAAVPQAATPATSKLSPRAKSTPIKPPAPLAMCTPAVVGTGAASTPAALEAPGAPQVLLPANQTIPSEERAPRIEERLTRVEASINRLLTSFFVATTTSPSNNPASVPLPASEDSERNMEDQI
ncbi:hypothetical protein HPB50_000241 [Hyalomma asiaticum]|uniref:Uncharacterized protein n=1 Tax=Hyalomma asiaticum TaxID=266040 RepID=A0ACB7SCV8_HYAAI|nr:hypothetical protein HPB50_000241 [Hyalomma asiaticum]